MKPPAFQFYPDDFLGGTQNFTDAEAGLYIRLLCAQWSAGFLPNDDAELATYSRNGTNLARVRRKFVVGPDGFLRNERMEIERTKQLAYRAKQAENGSLGGRPPKPKEKPKKPKPNPSVTSGLSQTEAKKSPPVSVSDSVSDSETPSAETTASAKPPLVYAREPIIDSLARIECQNLGEITGQAWRRYATARKEITARWGDLTTLPAEITRRAENLRQLYPKIKPTAMSLASHWAECAQAPLEFSGNTRPVFRADNLAAASQ